MDEFLSRHARKVLLGDRQCTATARDGTRCGRASALGQFVCDKHGAKAPLSIQAGKERLALLAEPALDALLRALKTGPPCEVCGRSDADRDPVVVRAAQIVLDRCGHHPTLTVQVEQPSDDDDLSGLSEDEQIEVMQKKVDRLQEMLTLLRRQRAIDGLSADAAIDVLTAPELPAARDAAIDDSDFVVVPEDDEASPALEASDVWSSPRGGVTITDETPENPRENDDEQ